MARTTLFFSPRLGKKSKYDCAVIFQKCPECVLWLDFSASIKYLNTLKMLPFYLVPKMKTHTHQNGMAGMLKMRRDYFPDVKMTKGTKGTNSILH